MSARSASELLEHETARGRRSTAQSVYQTLLLNRIGVAAMAALSLLALFMYLRQTAALDAPARRAAAARSQAERDRLEASRSPRAPRS